MSSSNGGETVAKRHKTDSTEDEETILWRCDKEESYSDFAIIVQYEDSKVTNRYHVHKAILLNNGNKIESSGYFTSLFRNGGRFSENQEITINLDDDAATLFPELLDYLYTGELTMTLTPENAVVLLHLADMFLLPQLIDQLDNYLYRHFMKNELNPLCSCINLIWKYSEDAAIGSSWILSCAIHMAADALLNNHECTRAVLEGMGFSRFMKIVEFCNTIIFGAKMAGILKHISFSSVVSEYVEIHKADLNKEQFQLLTQENILPYIEPEDALKLLEQELCYLSESQDQPTSLQLRCITSLKQNQKDDLLEVERVVGMIPQAVHGKLLALTLFQQRKDAESIPRPESLIFRYQLKDWKKSSITFNGVVGCPCYRKIHEDSNLKVDYCFVKVDRKWYYYKFHKDMGTVQSGQWSMKNTQNTTVPPAWGWKGCNGPTILLYTVSP